MDVKTRRRLLLFVGIAFIILAVIVGHTGGFDYKFVLESTSNNPPLSGAFATYEGFSSAEQRMIRNAINGQRYVFEEYTKLPKPDSRLISYIGQLTIEYQNQYYTFTRSRFYNTTSLGSVAAIGLGVVGFVLTAIATRSYLNAQAP